MAMKIMPKTIVGQLHALNKGACDWGWQGLVAYGCQNCVVVVDPVTVQVAQVLDRHRGYVVKVKWARENYRHDLASPYSLRLASADYNGKILIWDVASGVVGAECFEGSKPVADMEWVSMQDISHDLLVALHPPSTLVLWNTENGSKLWKKTYGEVLQSFSFDPFDSSRLAFLGQDCVLFVDDFSLSKVPSSNGKKFYLSSPSSQVTGSISHSNSYDKLSEKRASKSAIRRMSGILVGEGKRNQEEEPSSMSECLELAYHKACRHHLILVYAKEVLVLDLDINQTVSIIPTERTGSPFMQVIPVRQRDVLICLHETGSLSLKARRWHMQTSPAMQSMADDGGSQSSGFDIFYDHRCQSDPLRVTLHNRVYGAACCPVSENKVALVMSNGKLLIWELNTVDIDPVSRCLEVSPLYTPGNGVKSSGDSVPSVAEGHGLNLASTVPLPKLVLCDLISSHMPSAETQSMEKHGVHPKFILVGLLNGLASPPVVIRMCPPLTTKNFSTYQPMMAVGSSTGIVQVYNLSSGQMSREFSVHSCAVRGIEWVSLRGFLSYAYPTLITNNNLVKTELMLTDIDTGRSTQLRSNAEEESPIEMIRVSYLKQYFIIVFKDKPFEVWDLRSHTLLRQMPKNFPTVTALEWSPSHNIKSLKKKVAQPETNGTDGNLATASGAGSSLLDLASTTPSSTTPTTDSFGEAKLVIVSVREHFVFTDGNGLLYHYIVDGNLIKEGSKIPPDASMGSITCIAWKSETLVLSDVDGNINLWDLKARVSRTVPTARGWIRKIKFAPGRGNMKLLIMYNDGVDVWDAKDVERVTSVKSPKDRAKVVDVDWAASDRPVLACADGCLHIMDLMCISGCSTMEDSQLLDPMFCPHMLPPKGSFVLKCLLQHQPWRDKYSLDPEELEDTAEASPLVTDQLYLLDACLRNFLVQCPFSTAQRCYLTAQLYGDESEMMFWAVALHYLRAEKAEPASRRINTSSSKSLSDLFVPTTPAKESQDLLVFEDAQKQSAKETPSVEKVSFAFMKDKPLEMCYDVICDSQTFRTYELRRVSLHDNKRVTNEHTRKCAESLILLGQADRAVQLLLETEPDSANYYVDSLRACLVASIRSSGASQSTIKLVATNLIANGRLSEGVQLLCLIDKGLDACRYLQTYDQWHQAAWLAKVTLDYSECLEVMKRWADHLASPQVDQKNKAMLVLLSLGQFTRVVELLYSQRYFDRAALFIEACREFGLLNVSDDIRGLVESVFLEYARFLLSLGLTKASEYYCRQAGQKGQALLSELTS